MAAVSERPRLAPGTVVRRLSAQEEAYVMVREPEERKYFKFEEWEHDLLVLLDGSRDIEELTETFDARHPEIGVDAQWMIDYVDGLRQIGLLERSEQERHLLMMDKLRTLRRKRFYDAEKSTLLQIHIPLFDPNTLMDRILPFIRFVWSSWFVGIWLLVFAVVLGFLIRYWDLYWSGFIAMWNLPEKTLWDWAAFFAVVFGVSIWHELGHGFTCKRFGGEVHDIGFMIFYLQPAFYCIVDDSYLFPRPAERIYVSFGGCYFELMICSLATALWLTTPAEWWVHGAALMVVFFTGLSAILLNINPLIKLDGYYVLMDWLDVPNLREESFEFLGSLVRRHLFRLQVEPKAISRRRRRIYLIYGIASLVYTVTLLTLLYRFFLRWLFRWMGPVAYLILAVAAAYAFRRRFRDAGRFVRHLWLDKRDLLRSARGGLAAALGAAVLILLLMVPRSATRIEATFEVEPGQRSAVRSPTDGVVRRVIVGEGAEVSEGQILAVLESPDLAERRALAGADLNRSLREAAEARRAGDIATVAKKTEEAGEAKGRQDLLGWKLMNMALPAPAPGIVTTPRPEESLGRFLHAGETFCVVDRLDRVRLAALVSEREIEEIHPGVRARILATAYPGRTLVAPVLSIAPVAQPPDATTAESTDLVRRSNLVRVRVEVDNRDLLLRPGMTGRVQFLTRPRSIAGKAWWRASRWVASLLW